MAERRQERRQSPAPTDRLLEQELISRARQQAAAVELGGLALAGGDLGALLQAATVLVAQTLEVEYATVLELTPDGRALVLRAGVGWKDGYVGSATVGAGRESQAGYTLQSDHPVVVEDLARETRFSGPSLLHDHSVVSGMSVIIAGVERPYGVLGTHSIFPRRFSPDDVNFLQTVGNVLAEAIKRKHVEDELRRLSEEERVLRREIETYSRAVVQAQEAERPRIARELHDEVGQALTGLKLILEHQLRGAGGASRERTQAALDLLVDLVERIQELSLDLRPAVPDDLGLFPAPLVLIERYSQQTGVDVTFSQSGLERRLAPDVEITGYRTVQKALTNVTRHAGVVRADVEWGVSDATLRIEVCDDGVGFSPSSLHPDRTSGLAGMRERARAVSGVVNVHSRPGEGTRVVAALPLA